MNKVYEKRESLKTFIREQTLGPGINGYRFVDIRDTNLTRKNLKIEPSINYETEILDIVPAAIYSTGILFPQDKSSTNNIGIVLDNNEQIENEEDSNEKEFQNNSLGDIESGDEIELNQMFPQTMGLTFCLDEKFLEEKELKFNVSFRYYKKLALNKNEVLNDNIGLLCEVDEDKIKTFLNKNNLNSFYLESKGDNQFLFLSKINSNESTNLKNKIKEIQKKYAEELYEKANKIIDLPRLTKEKSNLSNLKSTIYYKLKNKITDKELTNEIYLIVEKIELIENITDHFRNLLDAFTSSYGLWQSSIVNRTIVINNINLNNSAHKKTYMFNSSEHDSDIKVICENGGGKSGLKDIFKYKIDEVNKEYSSLSANIQISRDSRKRDERVFIKIQLLNTSTPFTIDPKKDSRYYSTFNELVNQKAFFGVKISVENKNLIPYSSHKYDKNKNGIYDEDTTTQFIYDQYKDYGIGHGCSVKWDTQKQKIETEYLPVCETPDIDPIPRDKSKAAIKNNNHQFILPLFLENSQAQEFKWLSIFSNASNDEVIDGLLSFVDSYGQWINNKRNDPKFQSDLKEIANQELDKCESDYNRMRINIETLLKGNNNKENINSFRLMNAAMFMQLWHAVKVRENKVPEILEHDNFDGFNIGFYKNTGDKLFSKTESASWRAFQLAFILLNLDGVFKSENDSKWEKRNEWVDLVWFPTGGGKTEAYLGLIALTIINRRKLYKEEGGGVAAIMRYTLRLLTLQQFERATLVIMALELIRRWGDFELGDEPITIGLWVGDNSLPNKTSNKVHNKESNSLLEELNKLKEGLENRIPFSSCPWCNSRLNPIPTGVVETNENDIFNYNKAHLFCSNTKCNFGQPDFFEGNKLKGAIPISLSDEIIYQHPPTLLFGTVDKFAQLAHKVNDKDKGRSADSRRLFGKGNWEEGKPKNGYLPPDLIIQDELHLLLGPLGSAVALFESAIDQLCTREDGTRPKVISSTATTRNTQLQIAALFDRKVNLFPKPGVECDDSFFAFYRRNFKNHEKENEQYLSKRKYIGVLPTGRTQIWMQMRLAAIIMTHRAVFELNELEDKTPLDFEAYDKGFLKAMNYYHTTISYFNSLKEVGKTQSQVQTYILKELRRVFNRVIRPQKLMHSIYTYGPIQESELTGRLSGEEVKNELKKVETNWVPNKRFAHNHDDKTNWGKVPPEFVVATNMISVGIDVSRFNTIIMNSMPRNTAEYIQASSRVARNDYGLVLTVHHPFRARDISYYEKFIEFHEKMYSYVEPISITPFTKKSVDRYMGLYLATMIRHKSTFTERESASDIASMSKEDLNKIIIELTNYFDKRRERLTAYDKLIENLLKDTNVAQIKEWIKEAVYEWKKLEEKLDDSTDLVFNNKINRSNQQRKQEQLYVDIEEYEGNIHSKKWQVPMSLRVIEPEAAIKINSI